MADGLLNKASIILTPTGYKAGTLYNVAPIDEPYEDFDFARTSTATRINSSGLVSNVATGVPRISYDSSGDNGHILLEPTSTNLITYSEDFSQSAWQKSNITLTPNSITSPDGNLNAYKLTKPTSSQPRLFELSVYPTIGIHTFTSFYKNLDGDSVLIRLDANGNTANCNVDLTTNTLVNSGANIISSNITQLSDGWIRVSVTANILSTSWVLDAANLFSLSVGSSVYIWGAQLEELSYSTSYIPTLTGSTVTRAAETATGAGSADLINSTEGVLYAEIAAFEVEPDFFISMNDGTQNNRVIIKFSEAIDNQLTAFTINSTNFSSITHTISDFTQYNKIALSYNSSYLKLFVNGQEVGTSVANPNLAVGLNVLNLSNLPTDKNVKGKVKALAVFNEALSDSELTQLTT